MLCQVQPSCSAALHHPRSLLTLIDSLKSTIPALPRRQTRGAGVGGGATEGEENRDTMDTVEKKKSENVLCVSPWNLRAFLTTNVFQYFFFFSKSESTNCKATKVISKFSLRTVYIQLKKQTRRHFRWRRLTSFDSTGTMRPTPLSLTPEEVNAFGR